MFGYEPVAFVSAVVALGALLVGLALLLQKNIVGLVGPLFVGAAAWMVGGLTTQMFIGVATAVVSGLLALLVSVIAAVTDALGIDLPIVPIVLLLIGLVLLSRRNGKHHK